MTNLIFSAILACFSILPLPRDYNTIFYNVNWEVTSKKFATYYRNSGFDNDKMGFDSLVTDYYMNGEIQMTGSYSKGQKEGQFIHYYPGGQISLKSEYRNNQRAGNWVEYFKNGTIKREVKYDKNKEYLLQYRDSTGASLLANNSCKYRLIYTRDNYYSTVGEFVPLRTLEAYDVSGEIVDGLKEGTWRVKKNKVQFSKIQYKNGTFLKGSLTVDEIIFKMSNDDITFLIVEPEKIRITEKFFMENGQLIPGNYLIDAIDKNMDKNQKKAELEDRKELISYFKRNFSRYTMNSKDTIQISVKVNVDNQGRLSLLSITPKVATVFQKEVDRVLNSIAYLKQDHNKILEFEYKIICIDELEYKK